MPLPTFEYHRPATLPDALRLKAQHAGTAVLLGGGMSLVPLLNRGVLAPSCIVSLSQIDALRSITHEGGRLRIGAMVSHATIARDARVAASCRVRAATAALIGDVQVRSRGTIGGSIAFAERGSEYLTLLAALEGQVVLESEQGRRRVDVSAFAHGRHLTVLSPTEVVVELEIPTSDHPCAYLRLARVQGTPAIVNAAAVVHEDRCRIAIGGALGSPVVFEHERRTASAPDEEELRAIAEQASLLCRAAADETFTTGAYRCAMAGVLARRVVERASDAPSSAMSQW